MKAKQLTILLADDDADDRTFFKQALDQLELDTEFTSVHDGEQLMNHLTKDSIDIPDVIFLDINMPRKSGIECLSEMKNHTKLKNIPVVMFSTSNSWDTINSLFKTGADVYIHKPSDFAQLKQVIHHALPIAAEKLTKDSQLKYILNAANGERPSQAN